MILSPDVHNFATRVGSNELEHAADGNHRGPHHRVEDEMTRRMNRLALGAGAAALLLGLGAAGLTAAQDDPARPDRRPAMRRGGPLGPGGPMVGVDLRGLDLTEAQRAQVRAIMDAQRAATAPLLERARTARQALQEAIQAQPIDEGAIRARSAEVAVAEADLAVSRARLHADIVAVLTPEQQAELAERREQRDERVDDRRERLRGRFGR
jgi:Spy/CpxP family protein refolding chaperone